jgi:hypothetical protein
MADPTYYGTPDGKIWRSEEVTSIWCGEHIWDGWKTSESTPISDFPPGPPEPIFTLDFEPPNLD